MLGLTTNTRYNKLAAEFAGFKKAIAPMLGDVTAKRQELEVQEAVAITTAEEAEEMAQQLMDLARAQRAYAKTVHASAKVAKEMEAHQTELEPVVVPAHLASLISAKPAVEEEG